MNVTSTSTSAKLVLMRQASLSPSDQLDCIGRLFPNLQLQQTPRKLVCAPIAEGCLLHREAALRTAKEWLEKRWTLEAALSTNKKHNPLLVAAGTLGIGKSAFGDTMDSVLKDCTLPFDGPLAKLTLVTSLRGATGLLDEWVTAETMLQFLAARVLRTALLPDVRDTDFIAGLACIGVRGPADALGVAREAAIRAHRLGPNAALAVVLVVDEVLGLITKELLRAFVRGLADLQTALPRPTREAGGVFFAAVLLGASCGELSDAARALDIPLTRPPLPLLEPQHCRDLVQRAFGGFDWARFPMLEHATLMCGGWPLVLQFFVDAARRYERVPERDFTAEEVPQLLMSLQRALGVFPCWSDTPRRSFFLLAASFLRYPLAETVMLGEETLRAASDVGVCALAPAAESAGAVTVGLPLVLASLWANSLTYFAEFVARHLAARVASYGPQGVDCGAFSLQQLLWSAAVPVVTFRAPPRCPVYCSGRRWLAHLDLPAEEEAAVVYSGDTDALVLLQREDGSRFHLFVRVQCVRFTGAPLDQYSLQRTEEHVRRVLGAARGQNLAQLPEDACLVLVTSGDTLWASAALVAQHAPSFGMLPLRTVLLRADTLLGATVARVADLHARLSPRTALGSASPDEQNDPRRAAVCKRKLEIDDG